MVIVWSEKVLSKNWVHSMKNCVHGNTFDLRPCDLHLS